MFSEYNEHDWPASLVVESNAKRLPAVEKLVRAFWPEGTAEEMRMLAALSVCLFTIDDELDIDSPPAFVEDLYSVYLPWWPAAQGAKPLGLGVRTILREVERFLREKPAFSAIGPIWYREAEATLAAMWQEAVWRVGDITPDIAAYLNVAEKSITTSWMAATLMSLTSCNWNSDEIAEALEVASAVSLAVRLGNDLRSYEREKSEGKAGAVAILARVEEQGGTETRLAEERAQATAQMLLRDASSQALFRLGIETSASGQAGDHRRIGESVFPGQDSVFSDQEVLPTYRTQFERGMLGLLTGVLGYLEQGDFPRAMSTAKGILS